jgi:hypothetical protein
MCKRSPPGARQGKFELDFIFRPLGANIILLEKNMTHLCLVLLILIDFPTSHPVNRLVNGIGHLLFLPASCSAELFR